MKTKILAEIIEEQVLYLTKDNNVIRLRAIGGFDRLVWDIITYEGEDYFVFTDEYGLNFEVLILDWQSNSWGFVDKELAKPIIDIFIKKVRDEKTNRKETRKNNKNHKTDK